jgi:hypothetical protein
MLAEVFFGALLDYVRGYYPGAVAIVEYTEIVIPTYGYPARDAIEVTFENIYGDFETFVYEGTFGDLFGELINE